MTNDIEPATMTISEVCARVNISRSTLRLMVLAGQFPPPTLRIGKRGKRWPIVLVDQWIHNPGKPTGPGRPRAKDTEL